ncbi:Transmembrane domain-containing protein [Spironucleus salmonicida]|uniref:Transmembrane domain-containing protein n=1 Tax=Spironucleus salmonicida TaxID=348837 RepID=A0A9P8LXD9_9EUKA|nr:Transmembrane domain-containing protein [Spironucleus salmonicida]
MHIYYQTPFKLLLYILQYCIVIKHYASTTHACLGAVYGNTWGTVLVVPTSVAGRYYTQNIQTVFGITCACTLQVRIAFLGYCVPGLISEYVLVRVVVYYIDTIVIYQISLQAPLPMHIYYQTPIKIFLYILQYCILIKHYPSTTHACLGAVYGTTWGTVLVVPTSVAGRYYTQNIQTVFGITCACTLQVRIAFLGYCAPGLISEYVLVSIVVYSINTIVICQISLQAPLPMHLYYQTPIKILLYILQYCIVVKHYASTTHAYRGAVYGNTWGTVLVVPTSVAGRYYTQNIQTAFGIACACTLQVRIAFLGYFVPGLISEYILVSIVMYYINTIVYTKYPYRHPLPMHIYYQTPIKIFLYILQYCILIKHYPSTTHACLGAIYGTTWGPVLVVPTSVADSYQRQNTNSLRHSLCLYSTGKNTLPSVLCTWAHK